MDDKISENIQTIISKMLRIQRALVQHTCLMKNKNFVNVLTGYMVMARKKFDLNL